MKDKILIMLDDALQKSFEEWKASKQNISADVPESVGRAFYRQGYYFALSDFQKILSKIGVYDTRKAR